MGYAMYSIILAIAIAFSSTTMAKNLNFYLNADFTYNVSSAQSIYMGISTALSEVSYLIKGHTIKIVKCDHRGITSLSEACIDRYLNDPRAFVMYGGLHSPPLITNLNNKGSRTNINKNQVLTMVPWAAAGSITRSGRPNWVYRLSVDDKYAGKFILKQTLKEGFKNIGLMLVDDGWGRYNLENISAELKIHGLIPAEVIMFDRDLYLEAAKLHIRRLSLKKIDALILVSNAPQAVSIFKAIETLGVERGFAIRSHWGITGGNIWSEVGSIIQNIDLKVIQTKFSFHDENLSKFHLGVFQRARINFPELKSYSALKAPAGFIHGYDLTKILVRAINKSKFTGDIKIDKLTVKKNLESLDQPIRGLIKKYKRPFKPYSGNNEDAHEALSIDDFRMFHYSNNGNLVR